MQTAREAGVGDLDGTIPSAIAGLDVEVQAMFERVRVRLGMSSGGPEVIGRYELRDWIGRGGMGQVYRAHDGDLEREVALKLVAPQPGRDPKVLRRRLRREAQVLAKLDHDNVVRVHDAGVHEGRVYLVMEFVRGPTLRELQTTRSLSTSEVLRLYAEAGRGLAAAHEQGVIHRDFKPDNVFVAANNRAKVGDFGLAYILGEDDEPESAPKSGAMADGEELTSNLTRSGEVLGTLGYMAPEQLCGEPVGARADQYAFCVAVWEALSDARPFAGAGARALLESMEAEPRGAARIDARLCRALRRGLARDPAKRHADMQALVDALEELRGRPDRRRRRGLVGMLALFGTLTAAGLGYGLGTNQEEIGAECRLAQRVASLRAEHSARGIADASSDSVARKTTSLLRRLNAKAERACRTEDPAEEQHVASLIRATQSLLDFVASGRSLESIGQRLEQLEFEFVSRASAPLSAEVDDLLARELEPHERAGATGAIVDWCDTNSEVAASWTPAEQSEFLLRCARARSRVGPDYEAVVNSFKQARILAETIGDDQRRFEANLGAAKTMLMRQQDHARGGELLDTAAAGLVGLGTSWADPRRAALDELVSIHVRAQGQLRHALRLQGRALLRQAWSGTTDGLVAAFVNFGNTLLEAEEPSLAERAYRAALHIQPDDPEAQGALGIFLVGEAGDLDEARRLCGAVYEAGGHDLSVLATLCLMNCELDDGEFDPVKLARYRDELAMMLSSPDHFAFTPSQSQQGWPNILIAYGLLEDFGPSYEFARAQVSPKLLGQVDSILAKFADETDEP